LIFEIADIALDVIYIFFSAYQPICHNCLTGAHIPVIVKNFRLYRKSINGLVLSKNSAGYLGTNSDIGCFSLSIAKLISTGQGGFAVTRDAETYEKLKLIRSHGVSDVINVTYEHIGLNFRFN